MARIFSNCSGDVYKRQLLGLRPGAISPMGLIHDKDHGIQLLIDQDVLSHDRICVHPCVNTQSVAMDTKDFREIFLRYTGHIPQVLEITGQTEG